MTNSLKGFSSNNKNPQCCSRKCWNEYRKKCNKNKGL